MLLCLALQSLPLANHKVPLPGGVIHWSDFSSSLLASRTRVKVFPSETIDEVLKGSGINTARGRGHSVSSGLCLLLMLPGLNCGP